MSRLRSTVAGPLSALLPFLYLFLFLLLCVSCGSKKSKNDFIGVYTIHSAQAIDSTVGSIAGWTLSLDEKDNFELRSPEKKVVGYWAITENDYHTYDLLLQGGGVIAYGRIRGEFISFDRPYLMFDSLFRFVSFRRK